MRFDECGTPNEGRGQSRDGSPNRTFTNITEPNGPFGEPNRVVVRGITKPYRAIQGLQMFGSSHVRFVFGSCSKCLAKVFCTIMSRNLLNRTLNKQVEAGPKMFCSVTFGSGSHLWVKVTYDHTRVHQLLERIPTPPRTHRDPPYPSFPIAVGSIAEWVAQLSKMENIRASMRSLLPRTCRNCWRSGPQVWRDQMNVWQ